LRVRRRNRLAIAAGTSLTPLNVFGWKPMKVVAEPNSDGAKAFVEVSN